MKMEENVLMCILVIRVITNVIVWKGTRGQTVQVMLHLFVRFNSTLNHNTIRAVLGTDEDESLTIF